jgi:hypothetical protein
MQGTLQAQIGIDNDEQERQIWFFAFNYFKINDRLTFNQDVAWLQTLNYDRDSRLFLRPQLSHQLREWLSLNGGLILLFNFHHASGSQQEVRPWVGISAKAPQFGRFAITHYLRTEERFEHESRKAWKEGFRFRYKLSTNYPLNHAQLVDKTAYAHAGYEMFSNVVNNIKSQGLAQFHRFDAGLGYRFSAKRRLEAVYIHVFGQQDDAPGYALSDTILQLKLRNYFGF